MAEENKSSANKISSMKKRPVLRAVIIAGIVSAALLIVAGVWTLVYNNVCITSDAAFVKKVDTSIERAEK